jgi:hypothetical protein
MTPNYASISNSYNGLVANEFAFPNFAEELANIFSEQARFLKGGEVPTTGHFGPVLKVITFLNPPAWRFEQLPREDRSTGGDPPPWPYI